MLSRASFALALSTARFSILSRVAASACLALLLACIVEPAALAASKSPVKKTAAAGKSKSSDKSSSSDDSADAKPSTRLESVKEIVVWNEHNGKRHDSGAEKVNLSLSHDGKVVWHRDNVEIPWEAGKSANLVVEVPGIKADTLRVEISSWHEKRGGLAEIEVHDKVGVNLATGGSVKSSDDSSSGRLGAAALIDGNYDSPSEEAGYWLLPEGKEGWAEIQLVPQDIPPPPQKRPEEKKGKKKLSRVPLPAEIMVSCEDAFELYINGSRVLMGHGQRCFSRDFPIANGDIITAKCEGSSDTKGGFCFLVKFKNGHHLSTANGWKVYTPYSPINWFNPDRAKGATEITKGSSGWVEREMKDESHGKVPQIWGTGKTVYLVMKADTTVLHPKMKPGQKGRKR